MIWETSTAFPLTTATSTTTKRVLIDEFNSNNTRRLNLEETKAKIASLEYIQNELNGITNVAK